MAGPTRADGRVEGFIRVEPAGLERIQKAIKFLPEKAAGRRVMVGMKRGMRPVRDEARDAVEPRTGALRKSIHVVNGKRAKEGSPYVVVRVNPRTTVQAKDLTGNTIERTPKRYLHWIVDGIPSHTKTSETGFVVYDGASGRPLRVKKVTVAGFAGRDIFGDAFAKHRGAVLSTTFAEIEKSIQQWKRKNGLP